MIIVALLVAFAVAAPQDKQEERPKVPKDSVELVVSGCLKGRVLAVSDVRQEDVQAGVVVRARSFRLAGKKDIMKDVKSHDGHLVDVTGLVRKSALIEPGVKVGKGIRIGGGQPVAGSGSRSPVPSEYIPVLDVETVRLRASSCGSGGQP